MPSKKKQGNKGDASAQNQKVGSDPAAAKKFADKKDFGIPAEDAAPDMTIEDRDYPGRPAGNKGTRSGASGKRTIGVWVGRPDGAPVPGLVGRTAAAPILFDAFARTGKLPAALPKPPKGTLVASNAKLPLPLRRFRPVGELVRTGTEQAPRIQFPLNGSRIDVDRSGGTELSAMPVKVAGGVLPLTMLVNGVSVGEISIKKKRLVDPPGPGFARLTVIDATGAADTVVIRIQ